MIEIWTICVILKCLNVCLPIVDDEASLCLQNPLPYLIMSHMNPVHTFITHLFTIPCNNLILLLCWNILNTHIWVGGSNKTEVSYNVFYWLDDDYMFPLCSAIFRSQTNLQLTTIKRKMYIWDKARGVQLDLVVTGFFYISNWLKFYKYNLG